MLNPMLVLEKTLRHMNEANDSEEATNLVIECYNSVWTRDRWHHMQEHINDATSIPERDE
jgi:hypothetical protein